MNLTPAQREQGRRNFLKALAGTPALAALAVASYARGPVKGGPVRVGFIGIGGQGRALLGVALPPFVEVRALCDINPAQLKQADAILAENKLPPAQALQRVEGDAREGRSRSRHHGAAALHARRSRRRLPRRRQARAVREDDGVGRRRAASACATRRSATSACSRSATSVSTVRSTTPRTTGILKRGLLGDVYHARLAWHRNGNWRRQGQPPSADYDPSRWGYPSYEHLLNWRLYKKYSRGSLRRARQPPGEHRELGVWRRARGGLRVGRRLPLPGRA